jgi:hypothetical protein
MLAEALSMQAAENGHAAGENGHAAAAAEGLAGLQALDPVACLGGPGSALLSRPAAKAWAQRLLAEVGASLLWWLSGFP